MWFSSLGAPVGLGLHKADQSGSSLVVDHGRGWCFSIVTGGIPVLVLYVSIFFLLSCETPAAASLSLFCCFCFFL